MYEFIINPRSGRRVQITGKLGRSILNNYIKQLKHFVQRGGGAGWDASGSGRWKQGGRDAYGADEAAFLNFLGVRVNLETDTNKVTGLTRFYNGETPPLFQRGFAEYVDEVVSHDRMVAFLDLINRILHARRLAQRDRRGGNEGHAIFLDALERAKGVIEDRLREIARMQEMRRMRFSAEDSGGGGGPKPCRYWAKKGSCKFGDDCRFSHEDSGGGGGPKPCRNWAKKGSCKFGDDCRFSHEG